MKILKPRGNVNFMGKAGVKARAHVFVSGRVHGVFFRVHTRRKAEAGGVNGWVCNLSDSRVEAVFEGEEEAVKALVNFCKRGPSSAVVTSVDVTWEPYTGEFNGFKIKY